jgi:hypothetical protein
VGVASSFASHAEGLPSWLAKDQMPVAPPSSIRDQSGVFTRDPAAYQRISDRLKQLENTHGYKIYLMVEPVLIGTTAQELAAQLRQIWLPKGDGFVVVYENDSRSVGIGRDFTAHNLSTAASPQMPTFETASLIAHAFQSTDPKLAPEKYIEAFTLELAAGSERFFTGQQTPEKPISWGKIALFTLTATTLFGLGWYGLSRLLARTVMREITTFQFPNSGQAERLGAPSGASVTAHRFGPPPEA